MRYCRQCGDPVVVVAQDGYYWMKTESGFGDDIYNGWALIQVMDGTMYLHGTDEYWPVDFSKEMILISPPGNLASGEVLDTLKWESSEIEPLAILAQNERCAGCGDDSASVWSISDSNWEYAGSNLCKACLTRMVAMLGG